jgi:hypothetical protein
MIAGHTTSARAGTAPSTRRTAGEPSGVGAVIRAQADDHCLRRRGSEIGSQRAHPLRGRASRAAVPDDVAISEQLALGLLGRLGAGGAPPAVLAVAHDVLASGGVVVHPSCPSSWDPNGVHRGPHVLSACSHEWTPTPTESPAGKKKTPRFAGSSRVRRRGLEPPREKPPTRPSTSRSACPMRPRSANDALLCRGVSDADVSDGMDALRFVLTAVPQQRCR